MSSLEADMVVGIYRKKWGTDLISGLVSGLGMILGWNAGLVSKWIWFYLLCYKYAWWLLTQPRYCI